MGVPVGCAACLDLRIGPDYLNDAVAAGDIDLVFMNRPLNCDPELVTKIQEGRREDVRPCMKCMHCHDSIGTNREVPSACRMNAASFVSLTEGMAPAPAEKPLSVLVVGAGPAGMECARVAAERGHSVTLCDGKSTLGGLVGFARGVKGDHERFNDYLAYMGAQLEKLGVDVRLGQMVDAAFAQEMAPDAVVVATGGVRPSRFADQGALSPEAAFSPAAPGQKVAVLGGSVQAVDFAAFLLAQGRDVVMINEKGSETWDKGQSGWFRSYMLPYLRACGVPMHSGAAVTTVSEDGIVFTTTADLEKTVACDTVVDFSDMEPNTALADELAAAGLTVLTVATTAFWPSPSSSASWPWCRREGRTREPPSRRFRPTRPSRAPSRRWPASTPSRSARPRWPCS